MAQRLPALILTGASGFIGRNFLAATRDRYRVYAIARRAQQKVGVPRHSNVHWIQVDIGNRSGLERVTAQIEREGGAEYVVHLAAYYDFDNEDHPEYRHTNVNGTRNVLDQARALAVKRFIFASSVAACRFPPSGRTVTEHTPADADFPYARSKLAGEAMLREYSTHFPCSIVRLAAVFSDWCEYVPLYVVLTTWLSKQWNARILGGRGLTAIPYIHVRDLDRLFLTILRRSDDLPGLGCYLASPDSATSHEELYELATRFHFGQTLEPWHIPKSLALPGVIVRDLMMRTFGRRPFERPWMMRYLDRSLSIDSSVTRQALDWAPTPRLHILRRILFLIEKMQSDPQEWTLRNQRAMRRRPTRPSLVIHEAMAVARDAIVDAIAAYLQSPVRQDRFPHYQLLTSDEVRWYSGIVYELLMAVVRTGDRTLLLRYVRDLARRRLASGYPATEVCDALAVIGEIVVEQLLYKPEVAEFEQPLRDAIGMSTALAIDGFQDVAESLQDAHDDSSPEARRAGIDRAELEDLVQKLNAFYRAGPTGAAVHRSEHHHAANRVS